MPPPRGEGRCSGAAPPVHCLSFLLQRTFGRLRTVQGTFFELTAHWTVIHEGDVTCVGDVYKASVHICQLTSVRPVLPSAQHAPATEPAGDDADQSQLAGKRSSAVIFRDLLYTAAML